MTEESTAKQPGPLKSFLAGGAGGICLVLVGHPLDTVKVRIQTQEIIAGQKPQYSGMVDCVKQIIAKEGPTGLYKGMAAPLAGVAPMYALCFLGYGVGKKIFCDDDAFDNLKLFQIGMAGATSAIFTTPILGPGERLKCVLQIQNNPGYKGVKYNGYKELVSGLYKEGGVMGICRGSGATLVRDGVASFFYFSTYELLKKWWTPPGEQSPGALLTFMAGGFAGMANWAAMLPIDTVKSKYQVAPQGKYSGVMQVAKEIMKVDGVRGFYKGLAPVMVRAFPANAACFLGYEAAAAGLTKLGLE
mmetsp:Transcript_38485/g.94665  ORF Transcript_38485/g.94665 Transcript_38485/m.94665 type:complete len:302 (+) Transcript_38485:103-1008(+)|eukprot:CAMPEP_0206227186 /NCGR_PEP_ID=MMETSP0047_2-20121206/8489_1 /ASSEMBLY_ACC=CAM_ASM_000192 /TAXON_ID=195065 /ORGANISM="Chroomonas mesostigmatica_cf, Strain CCMP1168" /LENGTH=301 /DNA_ID=CAMNT_0053650321 /DNA_START=94 /DNA_END=999 /DNA_ORIENTATION=-